MCSAASSGRTSLVHLIFAKYEILLAFLYSWLFVETLKSHRLQTLETIKDGQRQAWKMDGFSILDLKDTLIS